MRIPVVLTTVRIQVDDDGTVTVNVDDAPYAPDRELTRSAVCGVLNEITTDLGAAVRVEIREADGTLYADIATPPNSPAPPAPTAPPAGSSEATSAPPAFAGAGFAPGEEVALAYVVRRLTADSSGHAAINLPPALLASSHNGLVMLGLTSQLIAPIEATA